MKNTNNMKTKSINEQVLELSMNPSFIKTCANIAKRKGITASEWNQDKVYILYMWATQVICNK
jgi:hypothetical protein